MLAVRRCSIQRRCCADLLTNPARAYDSRRHVHTAASISRNHPCSRDSGAERSRVPHTRRGAACTNRVALHKPCSGSSTSRCRSYGPPRRALPPCEQARHGQGRNREMTTHCSLPTSAHRRFCGRRVGITYTRISERRAASAFSRRSATWLFCNVGWGAEITGAARAGVAGVIGRHAPGGSQPNPPCFRPRWPAAVRSRAHAGKRPAASRARRAPSGPAS
jgi:hypothetical protein